MTRFWLAMAAIWGASGVTLGAYHAHGLQRQLESSGFTPEQVAKKMDNCETAVRYQMYHALATFGLGVMALQRKSLWLVLAGVGFTIGVIGFSGGLYAYVFADNMIHWSIVPAGGLFLIIGWLLLGVGAIVARKVDA